MDQNAVIRNQKHACDRCRKSKVRCWVDTVKEHGKCRRCFESEQDCVFELMAPRQQRQRTDTRLSILEKQVQALRAAFESTHPSLNTPCSVMSAPSQKTPCDVETDMPTASSPRSSIAHTMELEDHGSPSWEPADHHEVIPGYVGSETLSVDAAIDLLTEFVHHTLPEYPVLIVAESDDFERLRTTRPILLFAMITAASRAKDPNLFENLNQLLLKTLTEKVIINGEKSIELLQAILITEVWYNPPEDLRRLNFYLWIQIAGTVALELGLLWDSRMLQAVTNMTFDECIMNRWRITLAVYLTMSVVAISSRRPRMINMTSPARAALVRYAASAIEINDQRLAAWLELQLIAEDIEDIRVQVRQDVNTETSTLISHANTLCQLVERLDMYEKNAKALMNTSLHIHYLWTRIKLNELILLHENALIHVSCTVPDTSTACSYTGSMISPSNPGYIRAMMALVRSCHHVFHSLLRSDLAEYLHYPTVTTVRALYAMKELVALRESFDSMGVFAGELASDKLLSLEIWLNRLEGFLMYAKGANCNKIPSMALSTIYKVRGHISSKTSNQQKNDVMSSMLRPGVSRMSQHESDNDLEGVTDSTLALLKHDHPSQSRQQALLTPGSNMQRMESMGHEMGRAGDSQDTAAMGTDQQTSRLGFDFASTNEALIFSDSSMWDDAGLYHDHEWKCLVQDFNFSPQNW